ncbi:MAG: metallophosphoesterase family protein [Armatimonadota bacterium]
MKIVLASDTHLGIDDPLLSPASLHKRRRSLRQAFAASVAYCLENRTAAYIHAGDLFDNPAPDADELAAASRDLLKLKQAGVHTFLVAGDHDVTADEEDAPGLRALHEAGLAILLPATLKGRALGRVPDPCPAVLEGDGAKVAIYGVSWSSELDSLTPTAASLMKPRPWSGINLLVTHAPIHGGLSSWPAGVANADVVVAGHAHQPAMSRTAVGLLLVPGSTGWASLPDDAELAPGFWVLTVRGRDVSAARVQTPTQPVRQIIVHANDLPHDDPTPTILDQIAQASHQEQVLYLAVRGGMPQSTFRALQWESILEEGRRANLDFIVDTRQLWVIPEGQTQEEHGPVSPRREIEDVAEEMWRSAADDSEAAIIREARDLLLHKYFSPV